MGDSECPISVWTDYNGLIDISKERFLSDTNYANVNFNTLQSDLYDNSMAEILGRIETSTFAGLPALSQADWSEGHFLVIVWENDMRETITVEPYGDYYDRVESDYSDGDVEVWETFVDPFVLRDASGRDLSTGMDVVLNFSIAIVPKQWRDAYGDQTRKTAQEIADCLNQVLDNTAKLNGQLRNLGIKPVKKPNQTPKWKNKGNKGKKPGKKPKWKKPADKGRTWKEKQAAKKARLSKQ